MFPLEKILKSNLEKLLSCSLTENERKLFREAAVKKISKQGKTE